MRTCPGTGKRGSAASARRRAALAPPLFLLLAAAAFGAEPAAPAKAPAQPAAPEAQPGELKDLSLEQLMDVQVKTVYSASRQTQTLAQAPASVTIITADEIRKYGYRTLADILQSVRGFYVNYDRNYATLGIRGFSRTGDYNSRVLVMVDGHRINDNIYDSAAIGTEFILDVQLIDRVEIVRGPASALYGSNAFFGVINVITRVGAQLKGGELAGMGGSFDTWQGRATYGGKINDSGDYLISISRYMTPGQELHFQEFNTPPSHPGTTKTDADQDLSVFGKGSLGDFTLTGAFVTREKQVPTASFGTVFDDARNRTIDEHGYGDLAYDHWLDEDTEIRARVAYDNFSYHGDYVYLNPGGVGPAAIVNEDTAAGQWATAEFSLSRRILKQHLVTAGVEAVYNMEQRQRNWDVVTYLDDDHTSKYGGVYAQDDWTILENLRLNAGLRFDYYDTFGGTLNPRLALIYNPLPATTLKMIYGQAYRAPSAFELYYEDGGRTIETPNNLQPETILTWEFVAEQEIARNFRLTFDAFDNHIDDLINQEVDPKNGLLVFENVNAVEARGIEWEFEGRTDCGVKGRLSYTFTQTKDSATGDPLVNSPEHMVKANVIVPVWRQKVFLGLEEQYMSGRQTLEGSNAGGFVTMNATLFGTEILRGLDLSVSVFNVFNQSYGDPGGPEHVMQVINQDGRTFWVRAVWRF